LGGTHVNGGWRVAIKWRRGSMNRGIVLFAVSLILALAPGGGECAQLSSNGLEAASTTVPLFIEQLSPGAEKIGLSENRIQAQLELRLRQAGLTPADLKPADAFYAYIHIAVVGPAFQAAIHFGRHADFKDALGKEYRSLGAVTWTSSVIGTHGDDAGYVIQALDGLLDKFLSEYLKANPK
jgi:hypothetical protein